MTYIVYIHIKDCLRFTNQGQTIFTYPGEGDGCVKSILFDLVQSDFSGGISIEPHLSAIIHENKEAESEEKMYHEYIEYGKRVMAIVAEARKLLQKK